jgi:hypothetical protein
MGGINIIAVSFIRDNIKVIINISLISYIKDAELYSSLFNLLGTGIQGQ